MKQIKVFLVMALLAVGGALAQTEPAQTPATPTAASQEFSDLGNYITAMQKMIESSQTTITKEQAQKLLPYLRAIRASKAITPFMANWYKTQIEQQLTPEQAKALSDATASMGTAAETTPAQSAENNQQNQANTDQQNQGNTDQQNQGNTDQQNQGNTDQQNQANTDQQNQQNQANTDQQNQQNQANTDNQNNTAQNNTDTNTAQTNQPTTAVTPSADNPYTRAPYSDALAKVIEQLTQIASA